MIRIFLLSFLVACSDIKSSGSELEWGALDGINFSQTFLAAKTILLCGTEATDGLLQLANNAMWEWDHASGKTHQVYQAWTCQYRRDYNGSVKVAFGDCPSLTVGYHTQTGNHHNITICDKNVRSYAWQGIMTHEIGHAWGLCDQYAPSNAAKIAFHPNCDKRIRSDSPQRSVMGGLYQGSPSVPTKDDITGIRTLKYLYDSRRIR
jgi:hypothetical protein